MKLITWNIQWGKGCDGKVDLGRIVETARALADADLLCFQEVSVNLPVLDGGVDQPRQLEALLPDHRPVFRPAVDVCDGEARRFGNMILTRYPIRQVSSHLLPWPAEPQVRSMRRLALEVVLEAPFGPVRVVTTHLEYHAAEHREAQVNRILELQAEAGARSRLAPDVSDGPYRTIACPTATILCGDFNFEPADPLYDRLVCAGFRDAWRLRHPTQPHPPTCGVADFAQWPQGPHCRDFIFVTADLADRVRDVKVDVDTTASDHQPVLLELAN